MYFKPRGSRRIVCARHGRNIAAEVAVPQDRRTFGTPQCTSGQEGPSASCALGMAGTLPLMSLQLRIIELSPMPGSATNGQARLKAGPGKSAILPRLEYGTRPHDRQQRHFLCQAAPLLSEQHCAPWVPLLLLRNSCWRLLSPMPSRAKLAVRQDGQATLLSRRRACIGWPCPSQPPAKHPARHAAAANAGDCRLCLDAPLTPPS